MARERNKAADLLDFYTLHNMEALFELIGALIAIIFEITIHALVFVYLLVMAAFNSKYRARLRTEWDTSNWKRFSIVFGISLYSIAFIIALFVWISVLSIGNEGRESTKNDEVNESNTIEFTPSEIKELKKTKEIDELFDVAGDFLKRKLEERKEEQFTAPKSQ